MGRQKKRFQELRLSEVLDCTEPAGEFVIRLYGVEVEVPRGFDAQELLELVCVLREVFE